MDLGPDDEHFACSTPLGITASLGAGHLGRAAQRVVLNASRHHRVARDHAGKARQFVSSVLNASRHHRVAREAEHEGSKLGWHVLNASRHHRVARVPSISAVLFQMEPCSTPLGITASLGYVPEAISDLLCSGAQRLSASPRRSGMGTLSASPTVLSRCSTPLGITASLGSRASAGSTGEGARAQRLSASPRRSGHDYAGGRR